uniref:Uncharacterized protein n=1 Tax=Panagrolaimus davidi TaxID=227884 RepID=A0A914P633_9BILA
MHTTSTVSDAQKLMTIQAIFVCGEMFAAPLLHIFMLFWEFPIFVEIFAHFSWICLHGDTPLIYFIYNKSLRQAVIEMVVSILKFPFIFIKNSLISKYINNHVEPVAAIIQS